MSLFVASFGVAIGLPGAAIPNHHCAAPVFAGWDAALEAAVLERMIFGLDGQALHARVERRALGDSPAEQYAVQLQAEVVMQVARVVLLDHVTVAGLAPGLARGFRGLRKVPLLSIFRQAHVRDTPSAEPTSG